MNRPRPHFLAALLYSTLMVAGTGNSQAKEAAAGDTKVNEQATQLASDSTRAAADRWYKQGRKHLKLGEYEEARDCLDAAIKLDPQLIGAYKGLAKAWQFLKQPDREVAVLEKAIENNPVPAGTNSSGHLLQTEVRLWLYLDLANCLRRQGQRDRATRVLRDSLRQDPGFWSASRLLATYLEDSRDATGADRVIDSAFDHLCTPSEGRGSSARRARAVNAVRELYEELGRPKAIKRFLP